MPLVLDFPFSPVLFHLGPLAVHWYGLGYAVAFLVGISVAGSHLKARGLGEKDYANAAFWAILAGLLGARLYYDVQNGAGYFLTHPQHVLAVWEGGMAYYGAVFAVLAFLFLYSWRRRLSFWLLADGAALFAAAGQPIGRIGNIFNGDVIGYPSNLPWAIAYTNPATLAPQLGVGYQPAALYELLVGLGILAVLLAVRRRFQPKPGLLILLYLGLYAASQFGIFFLRANSLTAFGLKQAQLTSLVLLALLVPLALLWWRSRPPSGRSWLEMPSARPGFDHGHQT